MLFLELTRRQEDLRRIDELRSQDFDRRRNMMPMHRLDGYSGPIGNPYQQNQAASTAYQYNDFQQNAYPQSSPIDAAYTTNQMAHGYNGPSGPNMRQSGNDYNQQQQQQQYHHQGYDRKRPRY